MGRQNFTILLFITKGLFNTFIYYNIYIYIYKYIYIYIYIYIYVIHLS